eukprot:Nk52_evm49s2118 gene=Nk52_evmTU49s2118
MDHKRERDSPPTQGRLDGEHEERGGRGRGVVVTMGDDREEEEGEEIRRKGRGTTTTTVQGGVGVMGVTEIICKYLCLVILTCIFTHCMVSRYLLTYNKSNIPDHILYFHPHHSTGGGSEASYGLLTGYGYSFLFMLSALPFSRVSDQWSRKYALVIGLLVWSAADFFSARATNYLHFLAARALTGLGSSVVTPASVGIINDIFSACDPSPPFSSASSSSPAGIKRTAGLISLPTANGIFGSGMTIAIGVSAVAGENFLSWQWNEYFELLAWTGVGLALALVILPVANSKQTRGDEKVGRNSSSTSTSASQIQGDLSSASSATSSSSAERLKFTIVIQYICLLKSTWLFSLGVTIRAVGAYVMHAYMPVYIFANFSSSTHGSKPLNVKLIYGLTVAAAGTCSALLSSVLIQKLGRVSPKLPFILCCFGHLIALGLLGIILQSREVMGRVFGIEDDAAILHIAMVLLFLQFVCCEWWTMLACHVFQITLPACLLSTSLSILFLFITVGGSAGPEMIGLVTTSDKDAGMAIGVVLVASYLSAAVLFIAGSFSGIEDDMKRKNRFEYIVQNNRFGFCESDELAFAKKGKESKSSESEAEQQPLLHRESKVTQVDDSIAYTSGYNEIEVGFDEGTTLLKPLLQRENSFSLQRTADQFIRNAISERQMKLRSVAFCFLLAVLFGVAAFLTTFSIIQILDNPNGTIKGGQGVYTM